MYLCICMRLQASIHIKVETHVREHKVLPNDIFLETLSFRLPHHQNLHLYQIFSLLNVLME